MNLNTTTDLVWSILKKDPKARNSDDYLYHQLAKEILDGKGKDINNVSLSEFLMNRDVFGLPSFETVRRSRQKLQAQYPEALGSTGDTKKHRKQKQEEFHDYATSGSSSQHPAWW